jgi:signal transduction histidine kinase
LDTKSKNISSYSSGFKLLAIILVWLGFLGTMGACLFWLNNRYLTQFSSYTETYSFRVTFSKLLYETVNYYVSHPEKTEKVEQVPGGKTENLPALESRDAELPAMVNFVYYIRNTETGQSWSNLKAEQGDPIDFIRKQPARAFLNGWTTDTNIALSNFGLGDIHSLLQGQPYEVYTAVAEPLQPGDAFYDAYVQFNKSQFISQTATKVAIISLLLMAAAFIYLVFITYRRDPEEIIAQRPNRMYTDLHTSLVLLAAMISLFIGGQIALTSPFPDLLSLVLLGLILSLDIFIGLAYVLAMTEQIRTGQIFTNSLIYRLFSSIKNLFSLAFQGQLFKTWILLFLLGYGLVNGLLFMLCAGEYHGQAGGTFLFLLMILLAFNAGAVYFAGKSLFALSQIMEAVKQIAAGNTDYPLNSTDIPVTFSAFAQDILNLQGGLKKAVETALKGERMKTDLITNVSHDLKTPLTSIVNYVDLLKKEELDNQRACEYINILEEKSDRLKLLIEDLVEASKASSGNLAVNHEKVDLQELITQACGEFQEKVTQAELELHVNSQEESISIKADGRHMWRIAENLLSNVIKYSMPHSRVYIDMGSDIAYGSFTIKNISAFPLNISPEQLTERFVRGDQARSTEGSGLGLSIAQSLTVLQGGKFQIQIDGDLFKVSVSLPLWPEE